MKISGFSSGKIGYIPLSEKALSNKSMAASFSQWDFPSGTFLGKQLYILSHSNSKVN